MLLLLLARFYAVMMRESRHFRRPPMSSLSFVLWLVVTTPATRCLLAQSRFS